MFCFQCTGFRSVPPALFRVTLASWFNLSPTIAKKNWIFMCFYPRRETKIKMQWKDVTYAKYSGLQLIFLVSTSKLRKKRAICHTESLSDDELSEELEELEDWNRYKKVLYNRHETCTCEVHVHCKLLVWKLLQTWNQRNLPNWILSFSGEAS